jgi:hypothetical protein
MAPMLIRVQTRLGQVCGCVWLLIFSHYVLAPTRRSNSIGLRACRVCYVNLSAAR